MVEILDREDKEVETKKSNGWIPVLITNFILIFIGLCIYTLDNEAFFIVVFIGGLLLILINALMAISLFFLSSSNWKKWAIVLAIILLLILILFSYFLFIFDDIDFNK
ncbi:hypothetical protein [Bernardetia sp. MNP-M8]|uniref:hypothetical protein n=1 Tax=Bernardetia sp. MNP-M8 TaxID=3127470 RepID=UPI0030CE29FC